MMNSLSSMRSIGSVHFHQAKSFRFKKGQLIFKQGHTAEGLFMLKQGSVKLQRVLPNSEHTILKIVTAGELFGEQVETGGSPQKYTSYAVALEEVEIEKFLPESPMDSDYWSKLSNYLSQRNAEGVLKYERLLVADSEQRVRLYLKDLAKKIGKKYGGETLLKINLTHQEWALLTDTSRQTVTQTLSKWRKEGLLTYSRNRILIRNLDTF
ncbi:Crp/Fnr family transcriptional regulator [Algoriphagus namhaensis]